MVECPYFCLCMMSCAMYPPGMIYLVPLTVACMHVVPGLECASHWVCIALISLSTYDEGRSIL